MFNDSTAASWNKPVLGKNDMFDPDDDGTRYLLYSQADTRYLLYSQAEEAEKDAAKIRSKPGLEHFRQQD
jgi:hypothetical protein